MNDFVVTAHHTAVFGFICTELLLLDYFVQDVQETQIENKISPAEFAQLFNLKS